MAGSRKIRIGPGPRLGEHVYVTPLQLKILKILYEGSRCKRKLLPGEAARGAPFGLTCVEISKVLVDAFGYPAKNGLAASGSMASMPKGLRKSIVIFDQHMLRLGYRHVHQKRRRLWIITNLGCDMLGLPRIWPGPKQTRGFQYKDW